MYNKNTRYKRVQFYKTRFHVNAVNCEHFKTKFYNMLLKLLMLKSFHTKYPLKLVYVESLKYLCNLNMLINLAKNNSVCGNKSITYEIYTNSPVLYKK